MGFNNVFNFQIVTKNVTFYNSTLNRISFLITIIFQKKKKEKKIKIS
jgi:hypothetical protein